MKINSGLIILDKPKGISSSKAISILRKTLNLKKMGHGGTLDPDVTGVLPIFLAKSTRLIEYFDSFPKIYKVEATLGIKTDTLDNSGKIIKTSDKIPTILEFENTIDSFIGDIYQTPPMHSAIHYNGRRLYELAREGLTVERKQRKQTIFWIKNFFYKYPLFSFEVSCSRGTYIRTLIDDIGENLKCFASMTKLIRLNTCNMPLENSYSIEDIEKLVDKKDYSFITDPTQYLTNINKLELDFKFKDDIICGKFLWKILIMAYINYL